MAEAPSTDGVTKESLFPEGWEKQLEGDAPADDETQAKPEDESTDLNEEGEALADGEKGESEGEDETPDEGSDTMRAVEFAKAAGWKLEEFYAGVTVPINGQDVPLGQALNDAKALHESNASLSRERDALKERLDQQGTQVPMGPVDPEAQKLAIRAELLREEFGKVDWSQMERGDAAFQMNQINTAISDLERQAQTKQSEHMAKLQSEMAKVREESDRQIRARITEWNDPQVMSSDWSGVKDMLSQYGVTGDQVDSITDARIRHFLRDAYKARSQVETIRKKAKTVRKVGRTLSPGSRPAQAGPGSLKDAKRKIREARTREDALDTRLNVDLGPLPK